MYNKVNKEIGHFTVLRLLTCPWIGRKAGDDLVLNYKPHCFS